MIGDLSIRQLSRDQYPLIIPLLALLDSGIPRSELELRLQEMTSSNYYCLGAFDGDLLIGCSGFWILHKYYVGKHIEPDNVIVHPDYRNQEIGHRLMDWLEEHARSIECTALELNCYVDNPGGLRFWRSRGYRTIGEHMRKDLTS